MLLFQYKFLRGSFLISVAITLFLPVYIILFTFPTFTNLLISFTESSAVKIGTHLASLVEHEAGRSLSDLRSFDAIRDQAAIAAQDFGLFKYRVFSPVGEILFSSVSEEVGNINDHDYFHTIVAQGKVHSVTVVKDTKSLENEVMRLDVVETYVPIVRDGKFLGAFEIYLDITRQKELLNRAVLNSAALLIGLAAGFLLLLVNVRRKVVGPISQVSQAMTKMAGGDLEERVPVIGQDELSDMARVFNQMCGELQRTHNGLNQEKNKLTTIILSAREGIVVTDHANRVVLVNPAAARLLGKSEERILQEGFASLIDDPEYLTALLERGGIGLPDTVVFNNHVLNLYASTINHPEQGRIGSAALIRDVTDEKKLENQLRELSYTDGLTGLLNRRRMNQILQDELSRAVRYHQELGVLLFDVDHFKKFNDTHGHEQGDRVLQAVARIMKDHFRTVDYCCRYGGEEFCAILPSTALPGAIQAAERFRQRVEAARIDGLQVTISIGVTAYKIDGSGVDSPAELLKEADQALYRAKHAGRNRVMGAGVEESPDHLPMVNGGIQVPVNQAC